MLENAELTQEGEIFFSFPLQDFSEPLLYHLTLECALHSKCFWDNCAVQFIEGNAKSTATGNVTLKLYVGSFRGSVPLQVSSHTNTF